MKRSVARGYTVVELMMSLSVLAIGASGLIAMQKVTAASNQHAKNLAVATGIAEAWADALAADATNWNSSADFASMLWLDSVGTAADPPWIRPAHSTGRVFGPGFSPLGDPVNVDTEPGLARYCTDIRLTWIQNVNTAPGAGLIRAEIRVFWKRDNVVTDDPLPAAICDASNDPLTVTGQADGYHFVFLTTAISQQVGS